MTAFVDFESALIGMVSRNFPVSELVQSGVAVCMVWLLLSQSGDRIFPPLAQFPPLITDRGSVTKIHSQECTRALELCLGLLQQLPLTSPWKSVS